MSVLHFHGTPITPRSALHALAGCCFCVSFADPRDVEVCHEIGQAVMLDNGAFSAWRQGTPIRDWSAYYAWCERWLAHWTTWAVIPDVINGSEADNDALIDAWPHGDRGAPVWHVHERLARLDRLVRRWPLVCLGSSGAYADPGSRPWCARMAEAMEVACDASGRARTRLHLLRGLQYASGPYPLYSADSTSVARNHAGSRTRGEPSKDPARMAAAVDARQPPARWQRQPRQLTLAEAASAA
jgi:hypothetical protein